MKVCAITMVYRDHWALAQWFAHYAGQLGAENLYVVAHGADPVVRDLCPGASVITVPRDDLRGFDRVRGEMFNRLQDALGYVYDWVIRTDVDELVCVDPSRHGTLPDLLGGHGELALFALGMNIVELDGETPLGPGDMALACRRNVVFSGHYSKAWAVHGKVGLMRHGVRLRPRVVPGFPFVMPRGVYLAHLKYANRAVLAEANDRRMAIAGSPPPGRTRGLPGKAWREADRRTSAFLGDVEQMPLRDWSDAEATAYDQLQDPVRMPREGLVRARFLRFRFRTVLPGWFGDL